MTTKGRFEFRRLEIKRNNGKENTERAEIENEKVTIIKKSQTTEETEPFISVTQHKLQPFPSSYPYSSPP